MYAEIKRVQQLAGTFMPADAKLRGDAVARIGPAPDPVCLAAGAAWHPSCHPGALPVRWSGRHPIRVGAMH